MPSCRNYTDNELAALLKQGDQSAYTELFERYKGILYTHAYRLLENHDETEDIIQDVFLTLWQKRMELNISTSISSYLYIAVRNRIFKLFAKKKAAVRYIESLQKFRSKEHNTSDEKLIERELSAVIEREVEALPEKMRKVFLLSRDGTRSYKEIGKQLDISEKTVRNQVYNALQLLKVKLQFLFSLILF